MITLKAKSYRYANDVGINIFMLSRERADNPLPKRIYSHGKDVLHCKKSLRFDWKRSVTAQNRFSGFESWRGCHI